MTKYLMQDGTQCDDVSADKSGVLRGKNGVGVVLASDGTPQTVERAAEVGGNVAAANAGKVAAEQPGAHTITTPTASHQVGAEVAHRDPQASVVSPAAPAPAHVTPATPSTTKTP